MFDNTKTNNAFSGNKNVNNNDDDSFIDSNIPLGLAMAFGQNAAAMTVFANMSRQKKKEIIERASHVSCKKEMTELVQNISMNNLPD